MAEYASILFRRLLFCILFLGSDLYSFFFYVRLAFVSFLFIWVRGTVPLFRYDKLMYLAWKRFLPLSLNYLLFFIGVKYFIFFLFLESESTPGHMELSDSPEKKSSVTGDRSRDPPTTSAVL